MTWQIRYSPLGKYAGAAKGSRPALNVDRPERRHFADLGLSDAVSWQHAGAPPSPMSMCGLGEELAALDQAGLMQHLHQFGHGFDP